MAESHGFQEHWLDIDPERMERYEEMFRWNPATEGFYAPARIGEGQVIGDFGCGPGHAAIEFANRTGPEGHVHAYDINAEFVARARDRAVANGLGERITVHLLDGPGLPNDDGTLDRIIARNTLIYVPDPVFTLSAFRGVLGPGGIAHAIEGDWRLTAVEPVATADWRALVEAASWAWPHPEIGRGLYGMARQAGFTDISVQVLTRPDTDGRLKGMIQTVAGYAREGGEMEPDRIDAILGTVEKALKEKTYMAVAPQFVVTANA